ncbi:hypothetical protein ACTMTI_36210 [Nonomuraea sp. H19]|uniref:hypothetical protein n=1 Tax=Nonomuraea sp. H19 TaxID=3452206 RepID=UPI003F8B1932
MNDVEETLRRTFGQAAEQAPRLPGPLPARLESIHLRRRRRARMALAAAAVVLVAGGTAAVLRGGDITTAVQDAAASGRGATRPSEHVERVWPEAVRKIPAKGPGGEAWRPVTFIDDRTLLLVTASAGPEGEATAVYSYDLDSNAHRKIANMPGPENRSSFAGGFAVGGGHLVWWTSTKDRIAHLWAVPVEGGKPRIVADHSIKEGDGSGIDSLSVVDDKIVFSLYVGGVFTVPVAGGTVQPVEGGAGMHVLAWPWVGTPGVGGEPHGAPFGRIRNVETGETRTAVIHPGEELRICGVTICLGETQDGKNFFRQRDGSSQKNVPDVVSPVIPLTQNRFYVSPYLGSGGPAGVGLHDLDRGKSADLGIQGESGGFMMMPSADPTGRLLSYTIGDDLYLIDLAEIR